MQINFTWKTLPPTTTSFFKVFTHVQSTVLLLYIHTFNKKQRAIWPLTCLKQTKNAHSQSVRPTVKNRSNFTPDSLFLKTLIERDFTILNLCLVYCRRFTNCLIFFNMLAAFWPFVAFNKWNKLRWVPLYGSTGSSRTLGLYSNS